MKLLRRTSHWFEFRHVGVALIIFALLGGMLFDARFPVPAYAASPYLASDVIGQNSGGAGDFTTQDTNDGVNAQGFDAGHFVALDSGGHRLFVTDESNNRVLVFNLDSDNEFLDRTADAVLGQGSFESHSAATTQNGLSGTSGLAYDSDNERLFVGDNGNHRVMVFDVAAITNGENAVNVLGHTTYDNIDTPTSQNGLINPIGITYDTNNDRLFVADVGGHQVMVYDVDPAVLIANNASTDGPDAVNILGQDVTALTTSYDTPESNIYRMTIDTTNGVIYAGALVTGVIYRCATSTGCDAAGDWTVSYDTSETNIEALIFDSANGILYAGASTSDGTIYRCDTTTDCDDAGDWTVSIDSGVFALSFTIDTTNGVLYAGGSQSVNRCITSTGCDEESDWTIVDMSAGTAVYSLAFDVASGVIYAGTGNGHDIYRCNTSTSCDEDADWTLSYGAPGAGRVWSLTMDVANGVIYAAASDAIYRCNTSTSCDEDADWTLSYDASSFIISLAVDTVNGILYAGEASAGIIYRCNTSTSCDEDADWTTGFDTTQQAFNSLLFDASNRVLYAGSFNGGIIYRYYAGIRVNAPSDVAYDSADNRLFVADGGKNRVLVFDATSLTDNEDPVKVLGQSDFAGGAAATTQSGLSSPSGLAYDSDNERLFVSESTNTRVTVFDVAAITNGEAAVNVLGEDDFVTSGPRVTQDGFAQTGGLAYDTTNGHLFVADRANARVAVFNADPAVLIANNAGTDGPNAIDLLGQLDEHGDPIYTSSGANDSPNAHGFNTPRGTALDEVHHRLFVMEYANNRVLVFNLDSNNDLIDHTADFVLGQPDVKTISPDTTQSKLSGPFGITYDATNDRLFVGDYNNNRVMVFNTTSITNGENAVNVIGQDDFVTPNTATTQDGLWGPDNLVYDTTNKRLFVSDYNNSRVMVFNADPAVLISNNAGTDGPLAVNVLGEDDYVTATYVTTQDGLSGPDGLAYDAAGDRLFVGDPFANRVVVYNVDPAVLIPNNAGTNGPDAINVLGQVLYTTSDPATTQGGLSSPDDLVYDTADSRLFVADYANQRVMGFDVTSITNGEDAVSVLGQPDFVTVSGGADRGTLSNTDGLSYDSGTNRLYVSDLSNNRVIAFDLVRITTPDSLPDGTAGTPYSQDIDTEHEQGTVGFSVVSGSLPPGLVIGSITGTPTTAGSYTFTVRASDDNGAIGSFVDDQSYTIVIAAGSAPTPGGGGGGSPGGPPVPPVVGTPGPTPSISPSASASPIPSVSSTPFPSVSPIPLVITPTPATTPASTPLPSSPIPTQSINPSPTPSSSPSIPTAIVQSIGGAVSSIVSSVVEPVLLVARAIADVCGDSAVQATSCGAAAATAATAAAGMAAVLAQNQVVASSHWLFQVVGLRRKTRVWGVIYDSATKRPIPFAKVMLSDASGRLLETRFADRDGRYGFLASPQSLHQEKMVVSIRVEKQGYRFPSRTVTANTDAIVYDRLYHGGSLTISKDTVFNFNIPVDPTVAARATLSGRSISLVATIGDRVLNALFYVGLVTVPWSYYRNPATVNLVILIVFFAANAFRLLVVYRPYATIVDAKTGKPMAFALVTLNDAAGNRIAFTVSDEYGRCILSGPRGSAYDVIAYTPANITPQRTVRTHLSRLTGRGWVTGRVRL